MPSAVRDHEPRGVDDDSTSSDSIPTHPLGIKPLGNRYFASGPDARTSGGIWAALPDEVLMAVLERLDSSVLLGLGATCRFLYAFTHTDELWKPLFLR